MVPSGTTCADLPTFLPSGDGVLSTVPQVVSGPADPCSLPDPANYTGLANRLYRIEIHDGGGSIDASGTVASLLTKALRTTPSAGDTTLLLLQALTTDEINAIVLWGNLITIVDGTGPMPGLDVAGISTDATSIILAAPLARSFAAGAQVVGLATFKWSRDNAASAVAVTAVSSDGLTVTVASLGRDQTSALQQGDTVELTDETSALGPARGHLTTLATSPDPDLLTVTLTEALPARLVPPGGTGQTATDRRLLLRRWDGVGLVRNVTPSASTLDLDLDTGVQVQFGGTDFRPGDYWNFIARSADEQVQLLTNAPPDGTLRGYCPLAMVHWIPVPIGSPPSARRCSPTSSSWR